MESTSDLDAVDVVVVDANALIHHAGGVGSLAAMLPASLRQKAMAGKLGLVTLPEVVGEIKDKKAREALSPNNLPFSLETKEPTEEAIQAVSRFSKLTGDIHVLSTVDLKLVALAYDEEKTHVKSVAHLRTYPLASTHVENTTGHKVQIKMPGWDPSDTNEEWGGPSQQQEEGQSKILYTDIDAQMLDTVKKNQEDDDEDRPSGGQQQEQADASMRDQEQEVEQVDDDDEGWETARKSKNAQRKHKRKVLRRKYFEEEREGEGMHQEKENGTRKESKVNTDDQGVVVPKDQEGVSLRAQSSPVLSLTGDFAMQNVLLQMGLQVAGPKEGMLIKEARRFGLRCSACNFTTDTPQALSNDIFCPKCGNMNTLERCQVVVNSQGQVTYLQVKKKQQSLRGTQFSLPQPRTGRNANNPILREDSLKLPKHKPKKQLDFDEYNEDTWHVHTRNNTKSDLAKTMYLEEVKRASKKNPNARKLTRTNRRR